MPENNLTPKEQELQEKVLTPEQKKAEELVNKAFDLARKVSDTEETFENSTFGKEFADIIEGGFKSMVVEVPYRQRFEDFQRGMASQDFQKEIQNIKDNSFSGTYKKITDGLLKTPDIIAMLAEKEAAVFELDRVVRFYQTSANVEINKIYEDLMKFNSVYQSVLNGIKKFNTDEEKARAVADAGRYFLHISEVIMSEFKNLSQANSMLILENQEIKDKQPKTFIAKLSALFSK